MFDTTTRSRSDTGVTGRIARAAATHPWTTLGIWLVLIALAVVSAGNLDDVLTQDGELLVETEAERGDALLEEAFAVQEGPPTEYVVVRSLADDVAVTDADLAAVSAAIAEAPDVTGVVGPHAGVPGLRGEDGTTALLQVTFAETGVDGEARADGLIGALAHAGPVTAEVVEALPFGQYSLEREFMTLAEENLQQAELVGLPAALVILVLVFGAVAAALVPIVLAGIAIIGAIGMTALVGQLTDLSFFVLNMITMIGLAVGIDYTLFVVQRYREERANGRAALDAIEVAGGTATRAVVFSGITVVIALLGLLIVPDTIMRSLGLGAILVVLASLAACVTLLPAVLGLLGDRINALRMPWVRRSSVRAADHRFWNAVTTAVTRRPVVSVALAGGLLVALAIPYVSIELGQSFVSSLPEDSPGRRAFEIISAEFSTGAVQTPIVVTGADLDDPQVVAAVDTLVADLEAREVFGDITTTMSADGTVVLIEAATLIDPSSSEGMDTIADLRATSIPAAFDGVPAEALVTGDAAFTADYTEVVTSRMPLVFAFVLGLSFVLLLLAFRSIVVPLKAIVMNLLSVGAAYGLLVLVFQQGVGADLLGFAQVDVIETWIPVFLFSVLFGLSMDYHVFLLSRIKERFDRTGDNAAAVAFGLGATGAIITGAAAIMVAVFAGFAAGDLAMMQQMGFGLGAAVILDATVVRSVLVPATMQLLGERNWFLPSWLEWLPNLAVEGHVDPVHDEPVVIDLQDVGPPVAV